MTKKSNESQLAKTKSQVVVSDGLVKDLRDLIQQTRSGVAQTVNSALVQMYWQIGTRIRTEILKNDRADYGKAIVLTLSTQLTAEFGTGFSKANLLRMVQFSECFPDSQIVVTLSRQLSWSHFLAIIPQKDPLKREFYAEMCRVENWSVRTLRSKIGGMLFERTALSKKPAKLAEQELANLRTEDQLTPDLVFRDPYFLDFLDLKDTYSEKDLESAILRELQSFILELGSGFAFVGRQYRIVIDGEDHHIDLLFYHRKLKRLVVVDLKLGEFKAADKGQMELYLRWLEKYEMQEGEEAPLGLILCADKSSEKIELLRLDQSGIHVATYLTELPPVEVLRKKLNESIRRAKSLLEVRRVQEEE
ncbi:PDDEXK nuclease domain-containing protein [Mariniblastus sp.]|nr:PDDEXK nuclease domain-containing protein [Mariniblastus sp.]